MLRGINRGLAALATSTAVLLAAAPGAGADQWFKTDTHVHSSAVSGDAPQDIGIISQVAHDQGLDAIFLTDHTAAGTQDIGGVVANHLRLDDDIAQWSQAVYPTGTAGSTPTVAASHAALDGPTLSAGNTLLCELGAPTHVNALAIAGANSTTNQMVPLPANTGTQSLHMASTNSGYGETMVWLKRGPNLHSGDVIMKFAVNPTRIDAGSGLYMSATIGGDETIPGRPPTGYTPQGGTPQLGKHNVLVWQLGNARQDSSDPNARVITHQLPYMLGVWNTYTINVTQALNEIPAADRPSDLDALASIKLAAAANGGTADGYFDSFAMDTQADMTQAQEFIYRNQHVHDYDTAGMKIYAGQEMGYNRHVQRFNFDIQTPSEFTLFKNGNLGIPSTQASGYPAQLDHPGLPGGVSQPDALANQGYGADAIETAERGETGLVKNVMVDTWDGILKQGVQILGSWSSDAHRPDKFGPATYLLAPSIGFNDLMRSYYEGRSYVALDDFAGRATFNLDGADSQPYAARYPVYVSPAQSLARVHFAIDAGITPGSKIVWTRNGDPVATEDVNGPSYDAVRSFSLDGPWTYVRAELRDSTDQRIAMSQPIFFRDTADTLPPGMSFFATGVTTPNGAGYTKTMTKAVTGTSWDGSLGRLSLTLDDPAGSLVELRARTGSMQPGALTVGGNSVPAAASRSDFDAATGSSWWFDPAAHRLLIKARQGTGATAVAVDFTSAPANPPATPTGLHAHAASTDRIDVDWAASSGDVDGYTVYRDGTPIAITAGGTTHFTDRGLAGGTRYTYRVDAFDAGDNHSAQSSSASATTDVLNTVTLGPVADAYADQLNPTRNYGSLTSLRLDGSPVQRTYLRFDVQGLQGTVQDARLRVFSNSSSAGHDARSASNNWTEGTLNWNNAPVPSDTVYGSAPAVTTGSWTSTNVTSLVQGNGSITIALDTTNPAAINYASRESANPPQLVVQTSIPSNDPPTAGDASLATLDGTTGNWTPDVSDSDGDPLTCAMVDAPGHGTATLANDCSGGTYTPNAGYTGPDTFTYKATDSHGADSNVATVSATVTPRNHDPSAAAASVATTTGAPAAWAPSVTDPDAGDTLTCAIADQPAHGSATVASDCSSGGYSPAAGYSGPDSFTYKVTDSHGASSAAATVSAFVNGAPSAADRSLSTTHDQAGSWTPSVADPNSGDTLTCAIAAGPAHGSATVAADCSGGSYTPAPGYAGSDSFTYRATDNHGLASSAGTVSAFVNGTPTAADRSLTTTQDQAGSWTPSVSDPNSGDALTCAIVASPAHGTATVAADCSGGGYTPAPGYFGPDSFTYRATDSHGLSSAAGTVSATVNPASLFSDGFESGNLSAWTSSKGLTVQPAVFRSGAFAARGTATAGVTWARKRLPADYSEVAYRVAFRMDTAPNPSGTILKLRTAADGPIVGLFVNSSRRLGIRNEITATSKTGATTLAIGQWYTIELRAVVNGAAGSTEVKVDGARVADLSSGAANLGATKIGVLQLGENNTSGAYTYYFDDVSAVRGTGPATIAAARLACGGSARLALTPARRQRSLGHGTVVVFARSASRCVIDATAHALVSAPGGGLRSHTIRRLVKPGARTRLPLTFAPGARRQLLGRLAHGRVAMRVVANAAEDGSRLASRRITVGG
ncbi:MAG: large repetitive protein [Thermoleophilaceae bacterium]|nr:large repetitive protein [Thermoleophilaceae bacterium]